MLTCSISGLQQTVASDFTQAGVRQWTKNIQSGALLTVIFFLLFFLLL